MTQKTDEHYTTQDSSGKQYTTMFPVRVLEQIKKDGSKETLTDETRKAMQGHADPINPQAWSR